MTRPRSHWRRVASASVSLALLTLCAFNGKAQQNWIDTDLGGPTYAGYTVTNGNGTLDIFGGGSDIWNNTSQCHYRYAWAPGTNWDMTIQVVNFLGVDATWSKVEIMVDWADPTVGPQGNDAFIADMLTLPTGHNAYGQDQFRVAKNAGADWASLAAPAPVFPNTWMRVHRSGSVFSILYGTDGINWTDYIDIDTSSSASLGGGSTTVFGTPWPDPVCVGIAVTAHNDAPGGAPFLADATVANISATFPAIAAPTSIGVSSQVTNITTTVGAELSMSFVTTNNSSPNVVLPNYQWYRNGVAISNATSINYTILASSANNGDHYYCKATIPAPYNTSVTSITSATNTVTVNAGVVKMGLLKQEFFANTGSRAAVEQGNVGPASSVVTQASFDDKGGHGNNYIQRVSGYFIPPTTDNYVFFIAADDDSDLFLSPDSTSGSKVLIAQEGGWSGFDQWITFGGAPSTASQKRSDQFVDPVTSAQPGLNGIHLVGGSSYYIEAVHHQGGGGDDLSVTYQTVAQTQDANEPTYFNDGTNSWMQSISNNIALISYPDSTPVWSQQPTNTVVTEFTTGGLAAKALSGGEFPPTYQWYSNSVPIVGATGSSLVYQSMPASVNGAQFYCVATGVMNGLSSTSAVATINVAAPIFEQGWSKVAYWYSTTDINSLTNGTIAAPDYTITSPSVEQATANNEAGENYLSQMTTLYTPTTSGSYDFYVCSDDDSMLFVSTDATAAHKRLVAQETGWSNPLNWGSTGAGTLSQKSSATWSPDGGTTVPYAGGISLTAGQTYYIEVDHHEGGGGDNSEATITPHGAGTPGNGVESVLTGSVIGIYVPRSFNCSFTQQPSNATSVVYGSATFTAASVSDSTVAVGTTGDPRPLWNNKTFYQWYRNGVAVPGAMSATYTIPQVYPNDATVYCTTRALGYVDNSLNHLWLTSSVANITVTGIVAPHLIYAAFYTNENYIWFGGYESNYITVAFDTPMDPTKLGNPANYTVGGGVTIYGAAVSADNKSVSLGVSGIPTFPLSVTVNASVNALGGGLPLANTTANVAKVSLTDADIGVYGSDPAVAGTLVATGPASYTIFAEGSDIWNNADGFNFAYEMKTNDFDVAVRVRDIGYTSTWSKGGLMVRETLDAASRNWNIVNDPTQGANAVECNARISTAGASAGWDFNARPAPTFPNAWVRLKRTGNLLSAYYSSNGQTWTLQATNDPTQIGDMTALPSVVYVGLCTTAHNNDTVGVTPYQYLLRVNYDNYSSSYVLPATLHATASGGNITVTWAPIVGHLESSPAISGAGVNWQPVSGGTGGTATVPMSGNAMFFRVVNP